jgi:hypothetical protein
MAQTFKVRGGAEGLHAAQALRSRRSLQAHRRDASPEYVLVAAGLLAHGLVLLACLPKAGASVTLKWTTTRCLKLRGAAPELPLSSWLVSPPDSHLRPTFERKPKNLDARTMG